MSEIPVTEHFTIAEFACHDGTPYPIGCVDEDDPQGRTWMQTRLLPLCTMLERIRSETGGQPIHIDSGYRTPAYDERLYEESAKDGTVAPASRSQHPKGRAADITHPLLTPLKLFTVILGMYEQGWLPQLGGIGLYRSFVHIDCRPRPGAVNGIGGHLAIWGGTRPSNIL